MMVMLSITDRGKQLQEKAAEVASRMADYKCSACPMRKRHLYLAAGLIWGIPGVIISIKGINAYRIQLFFA